MNVSSVTLSLLGLLLFGLALGMLVGLCRGFRKSWFRLATLVPALLIAFFMTPLFTRSMANTADRLFYEEVLYGNNDLYALHYNFDGLAEFFSRMPLAILNLVVFIGLLFVLRFISLIIFWIFAGKVAPRQRQVTNGKTANGMDRVETKDMPRRRLFGMLVGAAQGLVLFFFLMIPVNGILGTINTMDNYEPEFTTWNMEYLHNDDMRNFLTDMSEFNDEINSSAYGVITRITGMRALSGPMLGYLLTVRMPGQENIRLRQDILTGNEIMRDFVAIQNALMFDENGEERSMTEGFRYLDDAYWDAMHELINKLFEIRTFRLLANSAEGLEGFAADTDLFLDEDGTPILTILPRDSDIDDEDDQTAQWHAVNIEFNNALVSAISRMNYDFIRGDMRAAINIIRSLFGDTFNVNGEYYTLFDGLDGVISNFGEDSGDLSDAMNTLSTIIGANPSDSVLNDFFTSVFQLGFFQHILVAGPAPAFETPALVRLPLMQMFNFTAGEAQLGTLNWDATAYDLTRIFITATEAIVGINEMLDDDADVLDIIGDMDPNVRDAVADILQIFTMEIGISHNIRLVATRFINDNIDLTAQDPTVQTILNDILDRLAQPDPDLNWRQHLQTLQGAIQMLNVIAGGNISDIIDSVFNSDFMYNLKNDNVIGPIVAGIIEDLVEDHLSIADGTMSVTFTGTWYETLEAMYLLGNGMNNVLTALDDGQNLTGEQIIDLIDETGQVFVDLVELGNIQIAIEDDLWDDFEAHMNDLDLPQAQIDDILSTLFVRRPPVV
ncbi:MAG: hypothetical protein FWE16_04230 [Firmicutes bacterium]|nr:hypothetical protein [Bacillota bacterium]